MPARQVEHLLGVPLRDFRPSVDAAAQIGRTCSLTAEIRHEPTHRGMRSATLIPTFHYKTATGDSGEITLFIKQQTDPGKQEARHYHTASQCQIPTPRYYGHLVGSDGLERLCLEFLPERGIDEGDPEQVRSLLSLIAFINTAPQRCSDFVATAPDHQDAEALQADFEHKLQPNLHRLWSSGRDGEAGEMVQGLCRREARGLSRLMRYARYLSHHIATLPQDALVQGDTGAHQMGWRHTPDGEELVVFDLDFHLGRRFLDISYILHDQLGEAGLSLQEAAAHYLSEYARWGGEPVSPQSFLEATHWLVDYDRLWSLPWLWRSALAQRQGGNPAIDENGNDFAAWLHENLITLLDAESKVAPE